MGSSSSNIAFLQVRSSDRARVIEAIVAECARRGARLVGRGFAATRDKACARSYAIDRGDGEWTTILASDDEVDFELAIALAERLETVVFCSQTVDAALYRAEGLIGRGAVDLGSRLDGDYRLWPDNVLGDRPFGELTQGDERSFELCAFALGRAPAALGWEQVFADAKDDRYCLTLSAEGYELAFGGRVFSREELAALERDATASLDARYEMRPEEESKLQLRSEPATSELALEGCSYTSWLGSQGACSLHYGIRSEPPAHWVYVTEGAVPEIVFRVDAAEARPSQTWFRLQEQVVERLASIKAKGVGAGCLRLEGSKLAFFVEPDLVVDGALEVLFVSDVEARALKTRESRKARATELRRSVNFCLHAGDPAAITPRS